MYQWSDNMIENHMVSGAGFSYESEPLMSAAEEEA